MQEWVIAADAAGMRLDLWLARHGTAAERAAYAAVQQRRADFQALTQDYRHRLERLYAGPLDAAATADVLVLHGAVNRAILSYALTGERTFLGNFEQAPGCGLRGRLGLGVEYLSMRVDHPPFGESLRGVVQTVAPVLRFTAISEEGPSASQF